MNAVLVKTGKRVCFLRNCLFVSKFCSMSKSALVIVAEGAEEIETVVPVDILRRAGVNVTVAGLSGNSPVTCSRNVVLVPDASLDDVANNSFDIVMLPGGPGHSLLKTSVVVGKILKQQEKEGKLIAAICAAPAALKAHSIGLKKSVTSYPSTKEQLVNDYKYLEDRVVIDGNLITSRGPGTAYEYALAIVKKMVGKEKVEELIKQMIIKP